MSEVLSQNEIDNLLQALSSGELAVALEMSREEVKGYLSSQMKGA